MTKLEDLYKRATPLPWCMRPTGVFANVNGNIRFIAEMYRHGDGTPTDMDAQDKADAALIDHAVNMLPKLVSVIERLAELYSMPADDKHLHPVWKEAYDALTGANNPKSL